MSRLYVETHFVIGYAKGQDVYFEGLLELNERGSVEIVIPEVCVMEVAKSLEQERRNVEAITQDLLRFYRESTRRVALPDSRATSEEIEKTSIRLREDLNGITDRAYRCLKRLGAVGRMIPLDRNWLERIEPSRMVLEPPDDMILHAILADVQRAPGKAAFLSGNTEDFDIPTVKRKLADSGVAYLRTGSAAIGWAMNTSFLLEIAS
jgi:hypothetical protein